MGFGAVNLDLNIGSILTGIGGLAKDIRSAITGEISLEKKAEMQQKLMEIEFLLTKTQTDINLEEAKNPNWFVAGWRPATGWLCVFALAWHYILFPFLIWIISIFQIQTVIPKLETMELITLLLGMLGLGGLRTLEKYTGSEDKR